MRGPRLPSTELRHSLTADLQSQASCDAEEGEEEEKKNYGEKLCSFKSVRSPRPSERAGDESSSSCESLFARDPSELISMRIQVRKKKWCTIVKDLWSRIILLLPLR